MILKRVIKSRSNSSICNSNLVNIRKDINSLIKDVVVLDIETSGLSEIEDKIIEIGAVKIKDGTVETFQTLVNPERKVLPNILELCKGIRQDDLDNAPKFEDIEDDLIKFIEDLPIIAHNAKFEKKFLKNIKNTFLDSIELAMILEPNHSEYNLNRLIKEVTTLGKEEDHRGLEDSIDTIHVINSLLIRLWNRENGEIFKLYDSIKYDTAQYGITWNWLKYIEEQNYDIKDYKYIKLKNDDEKDSSKLSNIDLSDYSNYEDIFKDEDLWSSSFGSNYNFRQGQFDLASKSREALQSDKNICIEAPTGIGKSIGYIIPSILESYNNNKHIFISTDTKELQMQLINKDIPKVLTLLNLEDEVKYGCIKGKSNYLCKYRLNEHMKDINYNLKIEEYISLLYLHRLIENGNLGDIEEHINYWIKENYQYINTNLKDINCDAEICNPSECSYSCFYKNRYFSLKDENITIINHSLLFKWPYGDEEKIEYLICDESHNLAINAYNYLAQEVTSLELIDIMGDMYINNKASKKRSLLDNFIDYANHYTDIQINVNSNINNINNNINNLEERLKIEYSKSVLEYDVSFEVNIQKQKNDLNKYIKDVFKSILEDMSCIYRNINNMLEHAKQNIKNIDNQSIFTIISKKAMELNNIIFVVNEFCNNNSDDYCRVFYLNKDLKNYSIKIVKINLQEKFSSILINSLKSCIFLSATLRIQEKMNRFKTILNLKKNMLDDCIIQPIYDYKSRTKILTPANFPKYDEGDKFIDETVSIIKETSLKTNGHILVLFTNKKRLERVYNKLQQELASHNIIVYEGKKYLNNLNDFNKSCIVLASRGCFEGVDIPGDGLTCVILDKIPNISPEDPIYKSLIEYFDKHKNSNDPEHSDSNYNYVNKYQLLIKLKQIFGRLIRSNYDYGYFIILDSGNNEDTINMIQKELYDIPINRITKEDIVNNIETDFKIWRESIIDIVINEISDEILEIKPIQDCIEYINNEFNKRNINARANAIKDEFFEYKIYISYYEQNLTKYIDCFKSLNF